MSAVLRLLSVVLLGLLVVALVPADEPKKPPTKDQIAAWIKQLGDDDFEKREEASKKLAEAGAAAEPALMEAAKSKDQEVRQRAEAILENFKYGIYPDTPKKVVDLINTYKTADPSTRDNIIKELLEAGSHGARAVMKLATVDPDSKTKVMEVIGREMNHAAPALLMEGNYETLELFLDISVAGDVKIGGPNYSAYFLLRDKFDAGMEKVKNKADFDEAHKQQIYAYMYRAKGDLKAAHAAALKALEAATEAEKKAPADKKAQAKEEKDAAQQLADELLYEAGDWKELAKGFSQKDATKDIEKLGYGAAYHRLAGNKKEFNDTVAAIVKYVDDADPKEKSTAAFYAAKALFLNDRPQEALKLLKANGHADMAFEILCVQLHFDEAFELLEQIRKTGGDSATKVEILAARTLYGLGEKDKAKPMFAKLAGAIQPGGMNDNSWYEDLIDAEARVGLRDDAFEQTGQILDQFKDAGWPSRLFPRLFPGRGDTAEMWFAHLAATSADTKPSVHLKNLRTLMDGKTPEKDIEKLLTDAETEARKKAGDDLDRAILALADTALQYKNEEAAVTMLEKTQSAATLQRLGDLSASKKQWDKAAAQYKAAWEKDKRQATALYLYGQALTKSGKEAEGKKLMEQSHWLPLGDETTRYQFVTALMQRGQTEASRRETDLLRRTSQLGQYHAGEAQRQTALDALARKEYLMAAEGHEKAMLRCLRTYINFVQKGAYVGVPAHVHRLRARGLLDAGKLDEARQEIAAAQALLPGDVDLANLVVPGLEKRNQEKDAKDVFEKTLAVYEKLCKDYPNCPWAHNSAAWLSVCCGRNLEAAKEHALKATELAPMNAGHIDTLAEIYFQMGDKDKALATQKRAIALDPKKTYFTKQLKRIEAGDPKAERPPENED